MIYLHYQRLDNINFNLLFGDPPHTIVIPRITIKELDKHKNLNNSNKIKERASKSLLLIESWLKEKVMKEHINVLFDHKIPHLNYQDYGLNPDWNDDVLIANIIQYKLEHNDQEVVLVTQDTGPRLTAQQHEIKVMQLPDKYLLPPEQDPIEIENRKLRETILKLSNSIPKLSAYIDGQNNQDQTGFFKLPVTEQTEDDQITELMDDIRMKYPKINKPNSDFQKNTFSFVSHFIPLDEEYIRYNAEIEAYYEAYEEYLRHTMIQRNAIRRTIRFKIGISNNGTAPAEDVDVHFHFPDGFSLQSEEEVNELPEKPSPPKQPMSEMQRSISAISYLPSINIPKISNVSLNPIGHMSHFSIRKSNSYVVRDWFDSIKLGDTVLLPEIFLTFDTIHSIASFKCSYIIRPANLPEPVTGQLHFVLNK